MQQYPLTVTEARPQYACGHKARWWHINRPGQTWSIGQQFHKDGYYLHLSPPGPSIATEPVPGLEVTCGICKRLELPHNTTISQPGDMLVTIPRPPPKLPRPTRQPRLF